MFTKFGCHETNGLRMETLHNFTNSKTLFTFLCENTIPNIQEIYRSHENNLLVISLSIIIQELYSIAAYL